MTRFAIFALFAGFAAGCGYDEDAYAEDLSTAMCDSLTTCEADIITSYTDQGLDEATAQSTYDTVNAATCAVAEAVEDAEGESDDSCDFDKAAAQDCVADVEAMGCDFWISGTGWPESCNTVCG